MTKREFRTIKIIGDPSSNERYREFHCFGRKNIDKVCNHCKLKFRCFTDRDEIEVPIKETKKKSIGEIDAQTFAKLFTSDVLERMPYKVVSEFGKSKIQLEFKRGIKQ